MSLESSKIKKEQFGLIWNLKPNSIKNKKQVPQFFPLFAKKARTSLDINLEKFVYTKTHLAIRTHEFFRETKKQYKYLIINILKDIIMQSKKIIK